MEGGFQTRPDKRRAITFTSHTENGCISPAFQLPERAHSISISFANAPSFFMTWAWLTVLVRTLMAMRRAERHHPLVLQAQGVNRPKTLVGTAKRRAVSTRRHSSEASRRPESRATTAVRRMLRPCVAPRTTCAEGRARPHDVCM